MLVFSYKHEAEQNLLKTYGILDKDSHDLMETIFFYYFSIFFHQINNSHKFEVPTSHNLRLKNKLIVICIHSIGHDLILEIWKTPKRLGTS